MQLLDRLLEQGVMNVEEMESTIALRTTADMARAVIDTVQRKGTEASSILIQDLRILDPYFSEHLNLS